MRQSITQKGALRDKPGTGGGMYFSQHLDCWVVEGYAEAEAVMRDPALEIPRLPLPAQLLGADEQAALVPLWEQVKHTPLYSVGAEHRRLRRELRDAFTAKAVRGWRPLIRKMTADLVNERLPTRRLEVIEDIGRPLLRRVMAEVLGIPEHVRCDFDRWAHAAMDVGKLGTKDWSQELLTAACRASDALINLTGALMSHPDDLPQGTVLSNAAARHGTPGSLSLQEVATNLRSLYTAGLHTTIYLVAAAAYLLFANEPALTAFRRGGAVIADVVRETLRFACPAVEVNVRRATCDTIISGHHIRRAISAHGGAACVP